MFHQCVWLGRQRDPHNEALDSEGENMLLLGELIIHGLSDTFQYVCFSFAPSGVLLREAVWLGG